MGRQANTIELIRREATKLFAERGYEAVKVTDISEAVGCVPSALYKHYEDKKAIYDDILAESIAGYEASASLETTDITKHPEIKNMLLSVDADGFGNYFADFFKRIQSNEHATLFRKLMMVEQFHNETLANMYDMRYLYQQIERFTQIFEMYEEEGRLIQGTPESIARLIGTQTCAVFGIVDRHPDKVEEAADFVRDTAKTVYQAFVKPVEVFISISKGGFY